MIGRHGEQGTVFPSQGTVVTLNQGNEGKIISVSGKKSKCQYLFYEND